MTTSVPTGQPTFKAIEPLGFDDWFLSHSSPEPLEGLDLARVTHVHKERCTLHNGETEVMAELMGKLLYSAASPLDYPAVGDWVRARFFDDNSLALIHEILPRKSLLKRKTPGKRIDFQLIAANIDTAFIVQSLDENFNLRRLERYLVMVTDSRVEPVVLLSKSDLLQAEEVDQRISQIKANMPDLAVWAFSNQNRASLEDLKTHLQAAHTYCLLGSSGVGKTTLLNNLIGEAQFDTHDVRAKDGKGRHTTTARQLIRLPGGALVVDTPGMRELGNFSVESGMAETFADITALSAQCRFGDCGHVHENGCAVLRAVEKGTLDGKRYQNFLRLKREANFNEMSYLQKKQKDKMFGKMIKTVMKHKKNQR